jgi:hypothetical protein
MIALQCINTFIHWITNVNLTRLRIARRHQAAKAQQSITYFAADFPKSRSPVVFR